MDSTGERMARYGDDIERSQRVSKATGPNTMGSREKSYGMGERMTPSSRMGIRG